jgi:hypothetical protein
MRTQWDGTLQEWLDRVQDGISALRRNVPNDVARRLDLSPASLDVLETWLLQTYPDHIALMRPEQKAAHDGIAQYIGETFIRALGGRWDLRKDDPKYAYYALPQITGYCPRPTPEAPHVLATAVLGRRTGKYLSELLSKMAQTKRQQDGR